MTSVGRPSMAEGDEGATMRILIATRNPHKLEEIRELVGDLPYEFLSLTDEGVAERDEEEGIEIHDTFAANSAAKARYFHERTGSPTVADDSGLCVDVLDGRPGVHTRRFAPDELAERYGRDEANNRHLLRLLEGTPERERGAEFRCVVAVETDEESFIVRGKVRGRIALEPAGRGGFGYDPVFLLPDRGKTFAELPARVKQERSHRAEAIQKLRPWLTVRAEQGG